MLGVILLTTIFSLIFAIIFYSVGYYGGNSILLKYKRRNTFIEKVFKKENKFKLVFIRLIPFSRTYISLLSGIYKQSFFSYLLISFLGIIIWNTIIVVLGFSLCINLDYISYFYGDAKILLLLIFSVSIIVLVLTELENKKG